MIRLIHPGGSIFSARHLASTASRWRSSFSSLWPPQAGDHLVLVAAGEDPKPQHVADRHPEPFDRAAGHLEPGGRHAELAGHEVHRARRQLARMPREPALDLEELQHQRQAQPLPPARRKALTDYRW